MGKQYRTLWATICLSVVLATAGFAQDTKYFHTSQECGDFASLSHFLVNSGQKPLFTGETAQYGTDETEYWGGGMFFVNQDTGLWTLLTMYADGTVCVTAGGLGFEPYTESN